MIHFHLLILFQTKKKKLFYHSHSSLFDQESRMSSSNEYNQTLYVHNLNEKLSKEQLKEALYYLFGQYGTILDIVALREPRLKGQAWVVYSQLSSAINAKKELNNFKFFGKELVCPFVLFPNPFSIDLCIS